MAVTKLGIRVSLDAKEFSGPTLLTWTCKRPLSNEKCLSLIQADLEDNGKEAVNVVRHADRKLDLEYAQDTEDPVKYLEDNDYQVEVEQNTCFIDLYATLMEVNGAAAAAAPPSGRKRERNHSSTSSEEEDSSSAFGQGKTSKKNGERQHQRKRDTALTSWIANAVATYVPQDIETGKFILGHISDTEQKGMPLWLPKNSVNVADVDVDASAGCGGGGDFMKSYGAVRSIQQLIADQVDIICGKSPIQIAQKMRKYLNNINERIRNGSLKGDNLAKRIEFAETWHTDWYGDYESGAQPESWPSTLVEAIANGNKQRITAVTTVEVTGGSGGVKGSVNTGAGAEGSGKNSKLREGYAMPRRESKQPKKGKAAAKNAKNSDGKGDEVEKAVEEGAPRAQRGERARRPSRLGELASR